MGAGEEEDRLRRNKPSSARNGLLERDALGEVLSAPVELARLRPRRVGDWLRELLSLSTSASKAKLPARGREEVSSGSRMLSRFQ